jgi:hypothetical protein
MNNILSKQGRKLILLLFSLTTFFKVNSQVSFEFNAINEYAFNTREALNLVIVNNHTKTFPVFINGKIMDGNRQAVVEFKSHEFVLSPGSNIITPMTASLADVNFSNMDIAEIESRTGTYPSGNYQVCIWLECVSKDCGGAGQDAVTMEQMKCAPVHVENPTPLLLATPNDDAEIEETRPMFTWIPPSPVAGSASLNYTMMLVEIMEGQTKSDALALNRPLIEMEGLQQPVLMYPSDLDALEPGKSYAWQVRAYVGKTEIAKSEQWKFKIKKKEKEHYRYYNLDANISEIIKVKNGEKLFFIIHNDMGRTPDFRLNELNGTKTKARIERVIRDSASMEHDIYSTDLYSGGLTKYVLHIEPTVFQMAHYYELRVTLNDKETILRFEITE